MATPVVVGQAYRLSFTIKSYDKEGDFSDSQNSSTWESVGYDRLPE